jgi:hypothetical protein
MSLYVLVGPDGKVYDRTVSTRASVVWCEAIRERAGVKGLPTRYDVSNWGADTRAARRLGWRVRKCKLVLEEEE